MVSFCQASPLKPRMYVSSMPLCAICPTHLKCLDLFTQIIFGEDCNPSSCLFPLTWGSHFCVLTAVAVFLQVRELDCIPVLLDCCNIDARNPRILCSLHLLYKFLKFYPLLLLWFWSEAVLKTSYTYLYPLKLVQYSIRTVKDFQHMEALLHYWEIY